jgi:hypothetical protein
VGRQLKFKDQQLVFFMNFKNKYEKLDDNLSILDFWKMRGRESQSSQTDHLEFAVVPRMTAYELEKQLDGRKKHSPRRF